MKKWIVFGLLMLMVIPATEAGRRKAKAGKIDNDVYTDSRYGFQMPIHENWKPRVEKDESDVRLILTQRNYAIPPDYLNAQDYTKVPRVVVYVDTCSVNEHQFIDSLTSYDYKSDQKNAIMKEFDFLHEMEIIPKGRSRLSVGDVSGTIWKGESKYTKEIQVGSSSGATRVKGSYGGAIMALKPDRNTIVLIHMMCEWDYYDDVLREVESMVAGMVFPKEKKGKK
ncbi:MAG: hypothetical protein KKA42_01170 [candidate division Zixibacteria bacterium]|nr:hypothetical protein [candidate division Zixibacteria bacterium]